MAGVGPVRVRWGVLVLALMGLRGCGGSPPDQAGAPGADSVRSRPVEAGAGSSLPDSAVHADPMEAVRTAVAARLEQPVRVEVDRREADGRWVFVLGVPRTPDGEPVDYARTPFASRVAEGFFDDGLCALLERRPGGWSVVALEIGPTDAPWVDWPQRYGVPRELVDP